ncbi:MAG: hypothetical protein IKT50_03020 [Clostridia bacterium]|nr:hypothetical protein [Clostridia bacterium]
MRKLTILFFAFAMLFSSCNCQRNYTHGIYEITFSARKIYNNSVGNDWHITYTCEDQEIESGYQWTVPLDVIQTVTIDVCVVESDTWPDVGFGSLSVTLEKDFRTSAVVSVVENKGRYKYNQAKWEIICKIKLVKKLEQKH